MSLSQTTIDTVKASTPLVADNAEKITSRMYEILFSKFPGTEKLFENSDPDQHKKLASALSAYAENIDNLDALSKTIEKMATTHVASKVKPEHYPLVAVALLHAMEDVLGEAATEEVLTAWKEAYLFLAHILITREKELYAEAAVTA